MPVQAGIKIILTTLDDPDKLACFKQYRICFYVAGEAEALTNALSGSADKGHTPHTPTTETRGKHKDER